MSGRRTGICVVATLLAAGCTMPERVEQGRILTQGMVISADDGAFRLESGSVWTPPFSIESLQSGCYTEPLTVPRYRSALRTGARRVTVTHPARPRPMAGVLALCGTVDTPGTAGLLRAHHIRVDAEQLPPPGQVSVVFESGIDETKLGDAKSRIRFKGWILWLSDEPLP